VDENSGTDEALIDEVKPEKISERSESVNINVDYPLSNLGTIQSEPEGNSTKQIDSDITEHNGKRVLITGTDVELITKILIK
jgi:hypothetical protein